MHDLQSIRERLLDSEDQLRSVFVDREDAIRGMLLCYIARQHYILVGDPGTGKTALARCMLQHFSGGSVFRVQLGAYTMPAKIFGPMDLEAYKRSEYKIATDGMLPAAHYAVIDEILKCPDGALNEMLEVLNEREFSGEPVPLRTMASCTNWPEMRRRSDNIAALFDRILMRLPVANAPGSLGAILDQADTVRDYTAQHNIFVSEMDTVYMDLRTVTVPRGVRSALVDIVGRLGKEKIYISARRLVQLEDLMRASAWLRGHGDVVVEDVDVIGSGLWSDESDIPMVRGILDTIDQAPRKALIDLLDTAITAYRDCESHGMTQTRVTAAVETIEDVLTKAVPMFNEPVFTADGRACVTAVLEDVRTAWGKLLTSHAPAIGDHTNA